MKSVIDISTDLYNALSVNSVKSLISGGIYKDQRPSNSTSEDVIINVITTDNELIQTAICNVNIHMPNLANELPNHTRFKAIIGVVGPILDQGNAAMYTWYTENQNFFRDLPTGEWLYNFRIRFRNHNTVIN